MTSDLLVLIKGLAAGVLLPVLMASLLAGPWGRRRGAAAQVVLFGLMSAAGAVLFTGLGSQVDEPPLLSLIGAARGLPPDRIGHELPARLAHMVTAMAMQTGRPIGPDEVGRHVERMMAHLMVARGLPEEELGRRMPQIIQALLAEGQGAGFLAGLAWAPYSDTSLVVVLSSGFHGGPGVGAATGLVGAAFRRAAAGIPLVFLVPTALAGVLGACLAGGRRPDAAGPGGRRGFAVGLSAGLLQLAWALSISPPGYLSPAVLVSGATLALIHGTGLGLFAIVGRVHRLEEQERRAREAEVRSRLALLTAQVRPHFLFNALNTVAAASSTDPPLTRHLIDCLARFLRLALRATSDAIPLEEELTNLEPYLELERARFTDRLSIRVDAPPEPRAMLVPALLLQPMVENSVAHGFRPAGEPLTVWIQARVDGTRLCIRVEDDGAGAPPVRMAELRRGEGQGIGLGSVRERLLALQPPGRMRLEGGSSRGFAVEVEIEAARRTGR